MNTKGEFRAFLAGFSCAVYFFVLIVVGFVVWFSLHGASTDVFGNIYVGDPFVRGILDKIRMIAFDLEKWVKSI